MSRLYEVEIIQRANKNDQFFFYDVALAIFVMLFVGVLCLFEVMT